MSGVSFAAMGAGGRRITVTVGGSGPYGFESGVFGAVSPASFRDNGGSSRTLYIIRWSAIGASATVTLRIVGASVPNTDATFSRISIPGVSLLRSAASYTANDGLGNTDWSWSSVNTSALPASGTTFLFVL